MAGRESPLKYTWNEEDYDLAAAVAGRESPLKYTQNHRKFRTPIAVAGRESPLKYTSGNIVDYRFIAVAGRESPLKYTQTGQRAQVGELWPAGSRRSSTLDHRQHAATPVVRSLFVSEKRQLLGHPFGFSPQFSVEDLHLAELVIGNGQQAHLAARG